MYFRDEPETPVHRPCGGPLTSKQVDDLFYEAAYADWMWQEREMYRILTRLAIMYGTSNDEEEEEEYG